MSVPCGMSFTLNTNDTSPEALAVQLECLRKISPHKRFLTSCNMSRQVRQMAFDAIRRRHPNFDEGDVQLLFIELTYGKRLANEVRLWKTEQVG